METETGVRSGCGDRDWCEVWLWRQRLLSDLVAETETSVRSGCGDNHRSGRCSVPPRRRVLVGVCSHRLARPVPALPFAFGP